MTRPAPHSQYFNGGWQADWNIGPRDGATEGAPAAALLPDRRTMTLTVRGTNSLIYRNERDPDTGVWRVWTELGGAGTTYWAPAVAADTIGNFRTFVTGTDGYIYRHYGSYWYQEPSGRQSLSAPGRPSPRLDCAYTSTASRAASPSRRAASTTAANRNR